MKRVVVDTNVPIVANGRADPANGGRAPSPGCRLAAIDFLEETLKSRKVLLDLDGEIQREYHRHLHPRGQPGVGDWFYLAILNSSPRRVERVDLPRDESGAYRDFPSSSGLDGFDPSDRKFVALARRARAPVANAIDSDWLHHRTALQALGVSVTFVCGRDATEWFEQ